MSTKQSTNNKNNKSSGADEKSKLLKELFTQAGVVMSEKVGQKSEILLPSWFQNLPDDSWIRVQKILPLPNNPQPLVDVSRATWWRWVANNLVPQPIRPSPGITLWNVGQLRQWLRDPKGFKHSFREKIRTKGKNPHE